MAEYQKEEISTEKIEIDVNQISPYQMRLLCKTLLDACHKFYSDPENVKKYEEWKRSKEEKMQWKKAASKGVAIVILEYNFIVHQARGKISQWVRLY